MNKVIFFIFFYQINIAQQFAETFIERVIYNHIIPNNTMSDLNKIFFLCFWQIMMELVNVKPKLLILCYLQID